MCWEGGPRVGACTLADCVVFEKMKKPGREDEEKFVVAYGERQWATCSLKLRDISRLWHPFHSP